MQLRQHKFQLLRDRKSQVSGILQQGHTLVGNVEKDDSRAENAARPNHLQIKDVCNPNQNEDQHLPADALKTYTAGQFPIGDGTHDAL